MAVTVTKPASALCAEEVSVDLAGRRVLSRVNVSTQPGKITALVGPNGSGKSTLLRSLYGAQKITEGVIRLDGSPLTSLHPREIASKVAVVTQEHPAVDGFTVHDIVALGRIPHQNRFGRPTTHDHMAILDALEQTGTTTLRRRPLASLSGGEKQRVMLARALAQKPQYVLLDEPTNHLDIRHQLELLELVRTLRLTAIIALHDLNLACSWCDNVLLLKDGHTIAAGKPTDVLTSTQCNHVFDVNVTTLTDPVDHKQVLRFSLKDFDA